MMFEAVFEGFVKASPVSVMNRMLFERIFAASRLDDLFQNAPSGSTPAYCCVPRSSS